jgi:hypothetical protein
MVSNGRWIRNRWRNGAFAFIWGLLAVGMAIAGAALLVIGIGSGKIGGGLVVFALFLILALFAARWAYGCANAGLLVTDDTVVIRNPWKKREVSVPEVLRFTAALQPAQYGNPTPGIVLELKAGRACSVWTLANEGFVWNSARNVTEWLATAEALNELVHSAG